MAATSDAALFADLARCDDLEAALPDVICRALAVKIAVWRRTPLEKGLRRVLNFGHTVGHALESAAGGELLHGECVALGMLPMCAPAVRRQLVEVLRKYGLPTETTVPRAALAPYLPHDKKALDGGIRTVYVPALGQFTFIDRSPAEITAMLEGSL
jgi:3-dehydroquinate synthase